MALVKERYAEPIPGYLLHEPLGRGGFGEVWKCEAPGRLYKAIKFVSASHNGVEEDQGPILEELEAIEQIKSIRHPFLLSIERVELIDGELVIVMELADCSLEDLFMECRKGARPGIERGELLRYLHEAADVLDLMNHRHGLLHLDVKPGNLFLVGDHVKVADFGQVQRLQVAHGGLCTAALSAITPTYAAAELFQGNISRHSDQYSLAVVYQELLTGEPPFSGKQFRQLAMQHTHEMPNLLPLPPGDRGPIGKALSKDPEQRFRSCREMIDALLTVTPEPRVRVHGVPGGSGLSPSPASPAVAAHLPGYGLIQVVQRTPSSESWEAQRPDGSKALVRLLFGVGGKDTRPQEKAAAHLQALRHPALSHLELLPADPGCLLLVSDLIPSSLRDRFQECRGHGAKGIPRRKLLGWLRQAAEALDQLGAMGLWHLGLNPRNLLLDGERVVLGDFGLVPLLWLPSGQLDGHVQSRYAAPEVLRRQPHPGSDQYSLAVIYQEMLTGFHPFSGRTAGKPSLASVSSKDRAILSRALDPDPGRRFGSNVELLAALEEATPGAFLASTAAREKGPSPLPGQPFTPARPGLSAAANGSQGARDAVLGKMISEAYDALPTGEPETWLTMPDGMTVVQSRFAASLPPRGARTVFERICQKWQGRILRSDDSSLLFQLEAPTTFWSRWLGRGCPLLVEIRWTHPRPPVTYHPEIVARIRTTKHNSSGGLEQLRELGPTFLDELRSQLQGSSDRRRQERVLWTYPVEVTFQHANGTSGTPVEGQGKDLSVSGMGLYLHEVPPGSSQVMLTLRSPHHPEQLTLPGRCVRVSRCTESCLEVGVLFE